MTTTRSDREQLRDLRVIAHPLRLRLLSLLTGDAYSAAEAARELGETQANVSYHLRRLAASGLVEAAGEERVRGGVAKRYRHDPASGESLARGDAAGVAAAMSALAGELVRRAGRRRSQAPPVFTDAELRVSPEAWAAIQDAARALGELIHRGSVDRTQADAVPISATIALFEMDRPAR